MTDAFEDEAEPTVSIRDLLDEVEEKELEADLVLGGDEGKECTYNKGYMKRQAIFSCLTCVPDGNGGVCTACSLSCHDGHEIVELWTKRNFRCDCGNSKFGISYCKLFPSKETENSENLYNHNFKGLYCTCNCIYPDPNSDEQEEMIQCCVCEDWFHEEHLSLDSVNQIPKDEEGEPLYEDFICNNCSVFFTFLTLYPPTIFARNMDNTKGKEVIENNPSSPVVSLVGPTGEGSSINPINNCKLGVKLNDLEMSKKPMFLTRNWREIICKCEECVNYYKEKKIGFLLDKEDSIAEYEKIAKQKRKDKIEKEEDIEQTLLNQLDHVGKIEFLSGVADMKSEIHSFLENIDQSKPVTTEDIHQIFENLAKKRRRT